MRVRPRGARGAAWCMLGVILVAPSPGVAEPQTVRVSKLEVAPTVDGDLTDWPDAGWATIPLKPAVEGDEKNRTGELEAQFQARISGGHIFVAVRWPDSDESVEYRPWRKRGSRYQRSKKRDDMLAVRFHMSGDYDRTMLSERSYVADVWLWSAARSNLAGLADDAMHTISTKPLDKATEFKTPGGRTVYIKKTADAGEPLYRTVKAAKDETRKAAPSTEVTQSASGSRADVTAAGTWLDGHWQLELSRALDTGHPDDVALTPGTALLGQIAVFNQGYSEHKSVSEPLLFQLDDN